MEMDGYLGHVPPTSSRMQLWKGEGREKNPELIAGGHWNPDT